MKRAGTLLYVPALVCHACLAPHLIRYPRMKGSNCTWVSGTQYTRLSSVRKYRIKVPFEGHPGFCGETNVFLTSIGASQQNLPSTSPLHGKAIITPSTLSLKVPLEAPRKVASLNSCKGIRWKDILSPFLMTKRTSILYQT